MRLALEALVVFVAVLGATSAVTAQARFTVANALVTYIGASNALTEVSAPTPLPVGR